MLNDLEQPRSGTQADDFDANEMPEAIDLWNLHGLMKLSILDGSGPNIECSGAKNKKQR